MKLTFLTLTIACCCSLSAQNPALQVTLQTTDLTCADSGDGAVRVTVTEGAVPATFSLQDPAGGLILQGVVPASNEPYTLSALTAGAYQLLVTDTNGHDTLLQFTLQEPPTLSTSVAVYGETCLNENTGRIELQSVAGGVPPYLTALSQGNQSAFGNQTTWDHLAYGTYFLRVEDASGCVHTDGVVLPAGIEFELSAGADTSIFSGDTLLLALSTNQSVVDLQWTPAANAVSGGLADNRFWPVTTTEYTVRATDANGCQSEDRIVVNVVRRRQVYAPNVLVLNAVEFSNSRFTLFAGGGVTEIERLQVVDRVGRIWFERRHFATDDPTLGWDGHAAQQTAPAGVYVWSATLRYSDGRTETLQGDVTVVR